jgi:5-methylcytosine-specific restriction protein A
MSWSRGYRARVYDTAQWKRTRERILKRDSYLCRCRYCKASDMLEVTTEVYRITPRAKGGSDHDHNLQAINADCHKRKTLEDQGGRPRPYVRIGIDGWPVEL